MNDIPVCIIGFNEVDALKECIPNLIASGFKRIKFYDGPFEDFPSKEDYSTDGTLEYLRRVYPEEVEIIPCGRMNHIDKQNFRFRDNHNEEYIIIVDCDEMVRGNYEEFEYCLNRISRKYDYPCYNIPFTDLDGYYTNRQFAVRLFKDPGNWRVKEKHWFFYYKDSRVNVNKCPLIGGIQLLHDSSVRPLFREEQMKEFQKVYTPNEDKLWLKINNLYLPDNGIRCYPCGCTVGYAYYYDMDKKKKAREINLSCKTHSNTNKEDLRLLRFCLGMDGQHDTEIYKLIDKYLNK